MTLYELLMAVFEVHSKLLSPALTHIYTMVFLQQLTSDYETDLIIKKKLYLHTIFFCNIFRITISACQWQKQVIKVNLTPAEVIYWTSSETVGNNEWLTHQSI